MGKSVCERERESSLEGRGKEDENSHRPNIFSAERAPSSVGIVPDKELDSRQQHGRKSEKERERVDCKQVERRIKTHPGLIV
jgi:hypothetical protein